METKRNFAVFTIVRNEPLFLRVWLNYYASMFPHEDVYVLDNETADGSVEEAMQLYPRVNFVKVITATIPHHAMALKKAVETYQQELLERYAVVVFAESDEFLIPNEHHYVDLLDYCRQFLHTPKPFVRAVGWNIVHQIDDEPPILRTPGAKLLEHRNSMWKIPIYDKTLITKVPMSYQRGFHNFYINDQRATVWPREDDLSLLHAWRIDLDEYCNRHQARLGISKDDIEHYFRTHEQRWSGTGDPHAVGPEAQVPGYWKDLLVY